MQGIAIVALVAVTLLVFGCVAEPSSVKMSKGVETPQQNEIAKIYECPNGKIVVNLNDCPSCPRSCDDGMRCTKDFCSRDTNYQCLHQNISPCQGNGICDPGEYGTADCPNCDDNKICTNDYMNFTTLKCVHEQNISCFGNGICEIGEYGSSDCPNCDDNTILTEDTINYQTQQCIHNCAEDKCAFNILKEKGYFDCINCMANPNNIVCKDIARYNAEVDAKNTCNGFT
jgi:hypothetical protein